MIPVVLSKTYLESLYESFLLEVKYDCEDFVFSALYNGRSISSVNLASAKKTYDELFQLYLKSSWIQKVDESIDNLVDVLLKDVPASELVNKANLDTLEKLPTYYSEIEVASFNQSIKELVENLLKMSKPHQYDFVIKVEGNHAYVAEVKSPIKVSLAECIGITFNYFYEELSEQLSK